ncbi:MAG: F0F1 ATP synthase subunit A, partial [Treponema sp.]|nr:F0F1 ATP synthase subunit A [Treponema sp.]
ETVVISWAVMIILIAASLILTRKLKTVPKGRQALLEAAVDFLNNFTGSRFGKRAKTYGPYIGTLFLFLLLTNLLPVLSPVGVSFAGLHFIPPFSIKPPCRDVNFTAALALVTILIVLFGGLKARGIKGWAKNLMHPTPVMLPFNLLEYIIRPLSLCFRLFGNVLGAFIIMRLIEAVMPLALPPVFSLYFDFLDGLIQTLVFVFLSTLFIAEAVEVESSH